MLKLRRWVAFTWEVITMLPAIAVLIICVLIDPTPIFEEDKKNE